jgi:hypothetical protein
MEFFMEAFRRLIGHEPNDLYELGEDAVSHINAETIAAVVVLYKDGKVSWYADD